VAYAKQHARGVDRVSKFNLYNAMPICKELISYFAAKTTQGAQGRRKRGGGLETGAWQSFGISIG